MRFKAVLLPTRTFEKLVASLSLLGAVAWVRLNETEIRFTIIPEQGTQVWAVLAIDAIFEPETYTIQSATANNTINLEVPLAPLLRALKSAASAHSASIRLTKKDNEPSLCVSIATVLHHQSHPHHNLSHNPDDPTDPSADALAGAAPWGEEHETHVAQNIPIRVLAPDRVAGLHEPRCREPDVHIMLPPLGQLKAVSDRYTRLASASSLTSSVLSARPSGWSTDASSGASKSKSPRLELAATMHGRLRLTLASAGVRISTTWTGLANPELDPANVDGGEGGVARHPSTRMREAGPDAWATVRVDARDWGRVLGVGRVAADAPGAGGGGMLEQKEGLRVVACFCHEFALVLYVYLPSSGVSGPAAAGEGESVLTYYVSSYSS